MPEGKTARMSAILASTRAASEAACKTADELLSVLRQSNPPPATDTEPQKVKR